MTDKYIDYGSTEFTWREWNNGLRQQPSSYYLRIMIKDSAEIGAAASGSADGRGYELHRTCPPKAKKEDHDDDNGNTKLFSPCQELLQEQLASSLTMSRPELTGHASLFYNAKEARKYDSSSRMIGVQREITERAIELLRLPEDKPCFVLDIGCGSGLSGQVLEEHGHAWVGCDVSRDMLTVANERISVKREERGTARMKDDDEEDDEEDSNEGPSTGDLMHHVSLLSYGI